MSRIGVGARLLAFALFYLSILPFHLVALRFDWPPRRLAAGPLPPRVPAPLRRPRDRARPAARPDAATLVLANHVSWLDIPVIGSLHPLSFIAKSEIDGWPLVGFFARMQRSVFIDRQRRRATAEVNPRGGAPAEERRRDRPLRGRHHERRQPPPAVPLLPRRRRAGGADGSRHRPHPPPAARDHLHAPQRPAGHPPGASRDRLVRRHGACRRT